MPPKIKTFAVPLSALLLLVLMILWLAGAFESKIPPGTETPPAPFDGEIFTVRLEKVKVDEEMPATVRSRQATDVSSRILARIRRIPVRAGDAVERGDLLVELDSRDLEARLAQARENIDAVTAQLRRAETHFERTSSLYRKESATKADLEQATADYERLKAQLAGARQALSEARTAQSYSRLTADSPGRVIDRFAEPGDMAVPGMKLLTLYDPRSLRIDAHVRETLALNLTLGQKLPASVPALEKTFTATIEEIVPAADPGTRSFLIKASVPDSAHLLPGMFARISVPAGEAEKLLIPTRLIKRVGQLDLVWVAGDRGLERRFVRTGPTAPDGRVVIVSGLSDGERLVDPRAVHPDSPGHRP